MLQTKLNLWRLPMLIAIAVIAFVIVALFLALIGTLFGGTVVLWVVLLGLPGLIIGGIIFETSGPADPTIALPKTVKISVPFEKLLGYYETQVYLDGESWRATLSDDGMFPPCVGERVSVACRDGLTIRLKRDVNAA